MDELEEILSDSDKVKAILEAGRTSMGKKEEKLSSSQAQLTIFDFRDGHQSAGSHQYSALCQASREPCRIPKKPPRLSTQKDDERGTESLHSHRRPSASSLTY